MKRTLSKRQRIHRFVEISDPGMRDALARNEDWTECLKFGLIGRQILKWLPVIYFPVAEELLTRSVCSGTACTRSRMSGRSSVSLQRTGRGIDACYDMTALSPILS